MKLLNNLELVLASSSPTRARLLRDAGIRVEISPSRLNEATIKQRCLIAGRSTAETALELALHKAISVSPRFPGRVIVGADQILEFNGTWYDKPVDRGDAFRTLKALSGRTHTLVSAVTIVRDGLATWERVEDAKMTMRVLSEGFIESYVNGLTDEELTSVGTYRIESRGIQLFSQIEGDFFTVLGLPLLSLMEELRNLGILQR